LQQAEKKNAGEGYFDPQGKYPHECRVRLKRLNFQKYRLNERFGLLNYGHKKIPFREERDFFILAIQLINIL
jgi:hypothetical protein